jgi:GLPGLI family protein
MKTIFLIYFILFSYNSISQGLVVKYKLKQTNSKNEFSKLKSDKNYSKMAELSYKALKETEKNTYSLKIDKGKSFFSLEKSLINDSKQETLNKLVKIYSSKGVFYQDSNKNTIIEKVSNEKEYLIEYNYSFYDWSLDKEYTTILGYKCYKATFIYYEPHPLENRKLKREITVWYAPELPFSFGPQGYGGLPGLILKKCQSNNCFEAIKIEARKTNIEWPNGKVITKKEYNNTLKKQSEYFKF